MCTKVPYKYVPYKSACIEWNWVRIQLSQKKGAELLRKFPFKSELFIVETKTVKCPGTDAIGCFC
jgi:hypothetical protein